MYRCADRKAGWTNCASECLQYSVFDNFDTYSTKQFDFLALFLKFIWKNVALNFRFMAAIYQELIWLDKNLKKNYAYVLIISIAQCHGKIDKSGEKIS